MTAASHTDRRIIVTSSSLGVISGVIFGIIQLLHPLTWEHTLIPIMSEDLVDYCTAPMPCVSPSGLYTLALSYMLTCLGVVHDRLKKTIP